MMISSSARADVDKLLGMYAEYKSTVAQQEDTARQLAKAKLKGSPTEQLQKAYTALSQQTQAISDTMTFATPLVWALYKFEAYAGEAQPISTMQDFRVHCSKPGYICTKRFIFVNQALNEKGLPTLADSKAYPDTESLTVAFASLQELSEDDTDFMKSWELHEYYKQGGKVAKWENFTAS